MVDISKKKNGKGLKVQQWQPNANRNSANRIAGLHAATLPLHLSGQQPVPYDFDQLFDFEKFEQKRSVSDPY